MPAERLSMRKIRDVLRMRFAIGLSEREIARALTLSNGSVIPWSRCSRSRGNPAHHQRNAHA